MTKLPLVALLLLVSCAAEADTPETTELVTAASTTATTAAGASESATPGCADVVDVTMTEQDGTFTVAATVRSSDTGWDKYADAWQIRGPGGEVIAERVLTHPHVDEQPFTRSLSGVVIPAGVAVVTVAARDSVSGFCGKVHDAEVPGR
jgi:hypothetical protein